jgi:hypothetical protein
MITLAYAPQTFVQCSGAPTPMPGSWSTTKDDDDARYVLVIGRVPTFEVRGWTTVGEAKRRGRRIR